MANKPVLLTVDDPDVLRAVGRECTEGLPHICVHSATGIPQKSHIFKPFFTKGIGEGMDLDLDLVRRIVAGQGSEIRMNSIPGETRFKMRLAMNGL